MKNYVFKAVVAFVILWPSFIFGQDVHFSQFYDSPNYLNPALTGRYVGDWQAGNIYRNQWKSISDPFVSDNFFFDKHFYYYSQEISGAVLVMHDQSGPGQLSGTRVYLNLAVPIRMGRSIISAGLQPGMVWKYYNRKQLSYPNQFDQNTGYFNSDRPNDDPVSNLSQQTNYFDLNMGILWKMDLPKMTPEVGFALHHLTRPTESFFGTGNKLGIRQSIHGALRIRISKDRYFRPTAWFTGQKSANMVVIGTLFGKRYPEKKNPVNDLFAGLYYRHGISRNEDAVIPQIGMRYHRWRIGISYDYNISGLKVATQTRGAYELSVIFTALSTLPKHSTIPCDRY